jgi:hypothetical protein
MATSAVILDIRANTTRALADFKRFSAQLDNKFLISGLKLDVVRNSLGQINREFQKAIGEQGLTAGQSLRAAQNQASMLLQTFKGFGEDASASITESFSSTFNQLAVTAGGTFDDVKKSLAATPWISADLPEDIRKKLGEGILKFQTDARRAGLGEDFGNLARQFLTGQVNAGDLVQSGDPLKSSIGLRLQQAGGGPATITNAVQRSQVLFDVLSDPKLREQLERTAKGAAGFRIILEDLNSKLFNPEKGVFGAIRKVTLSTGKTTTILDETEKLIGAIFGKQGTFVLFFNQISKIFGLEDPLKVVINGIKWITKQFDRLNNFLQSPEVQSIVKLLQETFTNIKAFVDKVYQSVKTSLEDPDSRINEIGRSVKDYFASIRDSVTSGGWDPTSIKTSIEGVGKQVRGFIENIGKSIREADVDKQGVFFLEIFKTVTGEVAQTLGTAISTAIRTVFSGKGAAVLGGAITVLYGALSRFFTGLFGGNSGVGGFLGGAAMAGLGILLARRIRGAVEGVIRPIQAVRRGGGGVGGVVNRLLGGGRGGGGPNLEGGRLGFQTQVITRMEAIIRILSRTGAGSVLDPPDGRRGRGGRSGRPGRGGPDPDADLSDVDLPEPTPQPGARRGRRRRALRRFGRGATIAGILGLGAAALFGGGAAQAGEFDPETGEPIQTSQQSKVGAMAGGAASGALSGAMYGAILGPKGAIAGAAIGGVIGGVLPLLDEGTRKGVTEFTTGIGRSLQGAGRKIADAVGNGINFIKDGFGNIGKNFSGINWRDLLIKALIPGGSATIEGLQGISEFASKLSIFDAIRNSIDGIKSVTESIREGLPSWLGGGKKGGNFAGLNFAGPALAQEARNSGSEAIIANAGEFVIPKNGFSTLANLVEQRLAPNMRSSAQGSNVSATFNVAINVTGGLSADNVEQLRKPVMEIISQAWQEASAGIATRGTII